MDTPPDVCEITSSLEVTLDTVLTTSGVLWLEISPDMSKTTAVLVATVEFGTTIPILDVVLVTCGIVWVET